MRLYSQNAYVPVGIKPGARVTVEMGEEAEVVWMDGWDVYAARLASPLGMLLLLFSACKQASMQLCTPITLFTSSNA